MIDMNKKYRTRDGRDVRLLCVDWKNEDYSVVGLLPAPNGKESIFWWTIEGNSRLDGKECTRDLIEVKPERWVNLYWKNGRPFIYPHSWHDTREKAYARKAIGPDAPAYIGTIEVGQFDND